MGGTVRSMPAGGGEGSAPGQVPLVGLEIGDDAAAWAALGFAVTGGSCRVGHVELRFTGRDDTRGRGILSWTFLTAEPAAVTPSEPAGDVDGLATTHVPEDPAGARPQAAGDGPTGWPTDGPDHPNGAVRIDHVVVISSDLDRTTAALAGVGLEPRRTREAGGGRLQRFFRMGEVILELVGPAEPSGDRPAHFWGLAFTVADIDATAAYLTDRISTPKEAVQPGRRIATLLTDDEVSVPVAVLSASP
jgi:hypothetical protein